MISELGLKLPVLAAPMAGGPSTPELVVAAGQVGSMGFLAGGYKAPQALADQIAAVRTAGVPFGVNLFAPNPVPISRKDYRSYRAALLTEAEHHGVALPDSPIEDDDQWHAKVELLLANPVPAVSFTFGLPNRDIIAALSSAGSILVQSVTSPEEARLATESGVQALIVQGAAAGGHSATFTPQHTPANVPLPQLIADVREATTLPLIAAGGISAPEDVTAALRRGAEAAAVGTALLRTHESGASPAHQAAVADPAFDSTVVTRAFTGRSARALRNHFTDHYDPIAPCGYPAIHHLTSGLRKAATTAGDTRLIHLWAGTGHRHAQLAPAADVLRYLAPAELAQESD